MKTLLTLTALLFATLIQAQVINPACVDTSFRIRYSSPCNIYTREHITTSDNGTVLVGLATDAVDTLGKGLIVRLDSRGEVVWSKKLTNGVNTLYLNIVHQLSDGNIVVGGWQGLTDHCHWQKHFKPLAETQI